MQWNLKSDALALTKWGGGLPHADLAGTARLLEGMSIGTAVMVSDMSKDRRVESALLFNFPENERLPLQRRKRQQWEIPRVERIITATTQLAELLGGPVMIGAWNVVGVTNQHGASRMRAMVY